MGIKESALAAITTITQSDLIRAVTAAGASRRITVANLAKAIIENYTGSSLAGSSQSVKAALDSLNSNYQNIVPTNVTLPSGTSYNEIASFNLPSGGLYLIDLSVTFPANSNGRRDVNISGDSGGNAWGLISRDVRKPADGDVTTCRAIFYYPASKATTLYANARQNSGTELSCSTRIQAIKLNNS